MDGVVTAANSLLPGGGGDGEKLKELSLGVRTNLVEHVEVIDDWFGSI